MAKEKLEKISIIITKEKEMKKELNFSMLLTYARLNNGEAIIKIGDYKCLFRILNLEELKIDED